MHTNPVFHEGEAHGFRALVQIPTEWYAMWSIEATTGGLNLRLFGGVIRLEDKMTRLW